MITVPIHFYRDSNPVGDGTLTTSLPVEAVPNTLFVNSRTGVPFGHLCVEGAVFWTAFCRDHDSLVPPWEAHITYEFPPEILKEEIIRAASHYHRLIDYYNSLQG